MNKYKVIGTFSTAGNFKKQKRTVTVTTRNIVTKCSLPPLSMSSYAFTGKRVHKKQKQVQKAIQEAESLMALELGRPFCKNR